MPLAKAPPRSTLCEALDIIQEAIATPEDWLIVNDGAHQWVAERAEITHWMTEHGFALPRDGGEINLSADAYQAMCDETTCESDRVAIVGNGDLVDFCRTLSALKVGTVYIL